MKKAQFFNFILLFISILFLQTSLAQDYTRWGLPEGAKARLGKGVITAIAYSPDGSRSVVGSVFGCIMHIPVPKSP